MERGAPRDSTNSKIRGKNIATSKHFKKKRRIGEVVVLDFSPEIVRPGGHSEEKDPTRSSEDRKHSHGVESSDRDLKISLQN